MACRNHGSLSWGMEPAMPADEHRMNMGWGRFAAMIATSTALMFPLMYQLVYSVDDATFSLTRMIAALVMGALMGVVMLAFMWRMYRNTVIKVSVVAGAVLLGIVLLAVNRSQRLVGDVAFMAAMIPHYSIAINNARKADIRDPRVRKLADGIIESQVREIAEMKRLVADIRRNGRRGDVPLPARTAAVTPDMQDEISEAVR